MALVKTVLEQGILQLLTDMETKNDDAKAEFASRLATLIDDYIKSVQITYSAGLATAPGGGAVTGVFNYVIS
jgi:hypothetical protein